MKTCSPAANQGADQACREHQASDHDRTFQHFKFTESTSLFYDVIKFYEYKWVTFMQKCKNGFICVLDCSSFQHKQSKNIEIKF